MYNATFQRLVRPFFTLRLLSIPEIAIFSFILKTFNTALFRTLKITAEESLLIFSHTNHNHGTWLVWENTFCIFLIQNLTSKPDFPYFSFSKMGDFKKIWSFFRVIILSSLHYVMITLRIAHAPGMPGMFSRRRMQGKPLVSDPDMHHGTCVTHVTWCMSGPLTSGRGENVSGIPGACATHNFTFLARGPWGGITHSSTAV